MRDGQHRNPRGHRFGLDRQRVGIEFDLEGVERDLVLGGEHEPAAVVEPVRIGGGPDQARDTPRLGGRLGWPHPQIARAAARGTERDPLAVG